jgi:hypothetical protein
MKRKEIDQLSSKEASERELSSSHMSLGNEDRFGPAPHIVVPLPNETMMGRLETWSLRSPHAPQMPDQTHQRITRSARPLPSSQPLPTSTGFRRQRRANTMQQPRAKPFRRLLLEAENDHLGHEMSQEKNINAGLIQVSMVVDRPQVVEKTLSDFESDNSSPRSLVFPDETSISSGLKRRLSDTEVDIFSRKAARTSGADVRVFRSAFSRSRLSSVSSSFANTFDASSEPQACNSMAFGNGDDINHSWRTSIVESDDEDS